MSKKMCEICGKNPAEVPDRERRMVRTLKKGCAAIRLIHGDCLEVMVDIPDGSVDAVIADPPYGTTACKWDSIIPLEPMWEQLKRVIKPNGAIVLFGSQPFTSVLVMSNLKWFKYCWVWDKNRPSGFQIAKHRPMMRHEDIIVFGDRSIRYNRQMEKRGKLVKGRVCSSSLSYHLPSDSRPIRKQQESQAGFILSVNTKGVIRYV